MIARYTRTVATSASILWALSFVVVVGQQGQPSTGLYHADPQHLWNRLHRHLHVRTASDGREFGLDEVDPLLWDETRHLLTGPSHTRALGLLDEFLNTDGERHNSRYRPVVESVLSSRALLKPESLMNMSHPRWAKWYPQSSAAVGAKAARVDWGLLQGIWQSVPR